MTDSVDQPVDVDFDLTEGKDFSGNYITKKPEFLDAIKGLPDDTAEKLIQVISTSVTHGPLPPPEMLMAYPPDVRSEILEHYRSLRVIALENTQHKKELLTTEQTHRHRLEDDASKKSESRQNRGQYMWLLATLGGFVLAYGMSSVVLGSITIVIGIGGSSAAHALAQNWGRKERP